MIELKKIDKKFDEHIIFDNFSLNINDNEITTILGPSGCGKTTLLKLISGIDENFEGNINGIDASKISFIFQEPRLLNWKSVYDNIAFVTDNKKVIDEALRLVDLEAEKNLYPKNLSGGMKQRVAIARAFAYPSKLLLMDEGFTGLDLKIKLELIEYFIKIWEKDQKTVVHITHDIDEALLLSDRVIQFSNNPIRILNDLRINIDQRKRYENSKIKEIKDQLINKII
jgi:NitT/TauT family transport system ATP-binding protein